MRIKDKEFSLLIDEVVIRQTVSGIAVALQHDLENKNPLFIPVLNGSFMFASDLLKEFDAACELSFVKLASYEGIHSSMNVKELIGLTNEVKGRPVVILEEIIDTGATVETMISKLKEKGADDIRIATLLFKPSVFKKNYFIDYVGKEIQDEFVVGYGLDYMGYGRNLKEIYKMKND